MSASEVPAPDSGDADPYLWLEEVTGDDALAWVRAHNDPTVHALTGTDRFAELEGDALAILDTDDRIPYVRRRGEFLYNFWRDADNPRGLWRRTTLESYLGEVIDWDVLIDVDALAAAEDENWVWQSAAMLRPDYDRALISLSRGGADAAVVREFDLTTRGWVTDGFTLPEAKSSIGWIDRDAVYVGTDIGDLDDIETIAAQGSSLTTSGYPRLVQRWSRGTALAAAETVFVGDLSDVAVSASADHTPGFERHFVGQSTDFFHSNLFELRGTDLIEVPVPTDSHASVYRDWLFVMPRSQWEVDGATHAAGTLLVFDYPTFLDGERSHQVLFRPDAHTSLQDFSLTRSSLILVTLRDVATEVSVLTLGDWQAAPAPELPSPATISVLGTDPDNPDPTLGEEVFWSATSFTDPPSLLRSEGGSSQGGDSQGGDSQGGDSQGGGSQGGTGTVSTIKQTPAFFEAESIGTEQFFATSDDGTAIPYFVVGKRERSGPGPTLLYGYGGFENSLTPGYAALAGRNWISRGGTYVVANIRGGGEYGPSWHTQAQQAGRHLVYEDFAAVARDLVSRGITTANMLAAQGGSNGGLLMGVMLTRYPELFGALVCQVPLIDMRRFHLLLAGASWMAEYGDPDDPEQWAFMREFSPYQNLDRAGQGRGADYPALLVTTSTRDDRVHPGHARKLVARLEEFGHEVSYYENIEGGHGGAADNKQAAFKSALAYEFLWQTVGANHAERPPTTTPEN